MRILDRTSRTIEIGGTLIALTIATALSTVPARADAPTGYVSVKDYGAKCDGTSDDTAAFQKAVNSTHPIAVPDGTCLLNGAVNLKAGTIFKGTGMSRSILLQGTSSTGMLLADPGSADTRISGIQISNLTLKGQTDTQGFSEHVHLANLNGVVGLVIENVMFQGFRGDGLYLGSGLTGGDERHNENVTIKNNIFDGVNHANRNAISIIDGNNIIVENNRFLNTTASNEPGAVDIEPNGNPFHVVKHIVIRNNQFQNINGNVGAISFVLNAHLAQRPSDLHVEGNTITGSGPGITFVGGITPTDASGPNDLVIANNTVTTSGRSIEIVGAKAFKITGNKFSGSNTASLIGYTDAKHKCIDGSVTNNEFSNFKGDGLAIFSIDKLDISHNQFTNIRNAAINFKSGKSSYVNLNRNTFAATNGPMAYAVHKDSGHEFTSNTNSADNNQLNGVSGNDFRASH